MKTVNITDPSDNILDHRLHKDWASMHWAISGSAQHELPIDMRFNEGHVLSIVACILFVCSAIGNITILVLIMKQRRQAVNSRINVMLMHLAIADLLVTFFLMPLEICWAWMVSWRAGNIICKIMAFLRVFGLFLSSFVLVCIICDRYYAVLKPFHIRSGGRRGKIILAGAWIGAVVCSLPQLAIFHVENHPNHTDYTQCVTFHVITTDAQEIAYIMFSMIMMYALPLIVIICSYASILIEIFRRTRNSLGSNMADNITRSSLPFLGKAKIRTWKMTIIIVFVFFICWTPYYLVAIWYLFDKGSYVDPKLQKGLYVFACTNSCMNPIVYGIFNIRARREVVKVMKGYHNRPEETSKTFLDGWLRTGDMVFYNEASFFFVTDRLKELIKVKGFQVAPAELEALIRGFPGVADAAVVGVPHAMHGEVPRAYIVAEKGRQVDAAGLERFVAAKVAEFKRLAGGVALVDAIPKNASGKTLRRALKEKYNQEGV